MFTFLFKDSNYFTPISVYRFLKWGYHMKKWKSENVAIRRHAQHRYYRLKGRVYLQNEFWSDRERIHNGRAVPLPLINSTESSQNVYTYKWSCCGRTFAIRWNVCADLSKYWGECELVVLLVHVCPKPFVFVVA